jgi:hypothetical protein
MHVAYYKVCHSRKKKKKKEKKIQEETSMYMKSTNQPGHS